MYYMRLLLYPSFLSHCMNPAQDFYLDGKTLVTTSALVCV